jgi:hypothetical protein
MSNQGSCQCGAIAFEFEGLSFLTFCHCKICQKIHGSAFAPFLHAESKTFKWLQGEEFLSYFKSSPHFTRVFCSKFRFGMILFQTQPKALSATSKASTLQPNIANKELVTHLFGMPNNGH